MKMKKEKNLMILATVMLVLIAISISDIVKAENTPPKIIKEETIDGVTYVTLECEEFTPGRTTSLRIAKDMLNTLDWKSFAKVTSIEETEGNIKFTAIDKNSMDNVLNYELKYEKDLIEKTIRNLGTNIETQETWEENNLIQKTTTNEETKFQTEEIWEENNLIKFLAKGNSKIYINNIEAGKGMAIKEIVGYEEGNNYLEVKIEKDGSLVKGKLKRPDEGISISIFESEDNSVVLNNYKNGNENIIIETGLEEGKITYIKKCEDKRMYVEGMLIEDVSYDNTLHEITAKIDGEIGSITNADESGRAKYVSEKNGFTVTKGNFVEILEVEVLENGKIKKTLIINTKKTIAGVEKEITDRTMWIDNNLIYTQIDGKPLFIPEEFGIKDITVKAYNDDDSLNVVLDDNGNEIEGTLSNEGKTLSYESYNGDGIILKNLGEDKIEEVRTNKITKAETTTTLEDNNILSFKEGNTELKFNKVIGVENVYYDDSAEGWIATLSDGTLCNVEDNGNKLVNKEDGLVVATVTDGIVEITRKDGLGRGNDIKRTYDKEGNEISIKLNDEELDKKFLGFDDDIINKIVNLKLVGADLDNVEVKDGKIYYNTGTKLKDNLPLDLTKTSTEIKSWKRIDSNTDGGTATITYGDGKSVTMRTEMLTTIASELNMIEDFDEIKVEGNILTYTTKGDNSYNAVIEFNDDDTKKSKTYTKTNSDGKITAQTIYEFDENGEVKLKTQLILNEDGKYEKTVKDKDGKAVIQLDVEIAGEAGVGVKPAKGYVTIDTDEIWSNKMGIKLKNVHEEGGVLYATLEDGSKGILLVDENKFVYDDSVDGVIHTLQAIEGGSLLEYYQDESEDYGTIKISIDKGNNEKETIIFDGIYDENKKIIKKGDKLIAEIDENGRILTDFNKNGVAQTIHYPANIFGIYVFGKIQKDDSEKIFRSGYIPVAFVTENGKIVIIKQDEEGYFYTDAHGNKLSENSAGVKEAKTMVTKSKIGPAFYAAVNGARGGIALSNLLNTWLDWDFMMGWRKKTDEFFSQTVIGRIISGKWEESVCHSKIEKIPNSIAIVNVNNVMGFAAHVEGERSAAITTNNETLYLYKITFGVNPQGMGNVTFELLIDGNKVDLDEDGTADKIELEADKSYSGTGENTIVRYKDKIYEDVCLKFYNTENLNAEFKNSLKDDKLCNKIVEEYISIGEISKPVAGSTTASGTSVSDGW